MFAIGQFLKNAQRNWYAMERAWSELQLLSSRATQQGDLISLEAQAFFSVAKRLFINVGSEDKSYLKMFKKKNTQKIAGDLREKIKAGQIRWKSDLCSQP